MDAIEVHGDRLLGSLCSELLNHRQDEYGGAFEDRVRYALEVVAAIKEAATALILEYKLPIIMTDFAEHKVEQYVKSQVTAITPAGVEAVNTETQEPVAIPCNCVVMAVSSKKVPFSTEGVTVPMKFAGDCSGDKTADIAAAVRSGYQAANEI